MGRMAKECFFVGCDRDMFGKDCFGKVGVKKTATVIVGENSRHGQGRIV